MMKRTKKAEKIYSKIQKTIDQIVKIAPPKPSLMIIQTGWPGTRERKAFDSVSPEHHCIVLDFDTVEELQDYAIEFGTTIDMVKNKLVFGGNVLNGQIQMKKPKTKAAKKVK